MHFAFRVRYTRFIFLVCCNGAEIRDDDSHYWESRNRANNHDDARSDRSPGSGSHSTHEKSNSRVIVQHDFFLGQTKQEPDTARSEERHQLRNLSSDDMPCKDIYEGIFSPE